MLIQQAIQRLGKIDGMRWSRPSEVFKDKLLLISKGHDLSVDGVGFQVYELSGWTAQNMLEVFTLLALELMKEDLRDLSLGPHNNYIIEFCKRHNQFLGPRGTYITFLRSEETWDGPLYCTSILSKSHDFEYSPGAFPEIERELFGLRAGTTMWTMRKMLFDKEKGFNDRFGNFIRGEEGLFRFIVPDLGPEDKLQELRK